MRYSSSTEIQIKTDSFNKRMNIFTKKINYDFDRIMQQVSENIQEELEMKKGCVEIRYEGDSLEDVIQQEACQVIINRGIPFRGL